MATDYLGIEWSNEELFKTLNSLQGSVRKELLAKATKKVAEQMYADEINAFRSAYSPEAYQHIIASPQRAHSKSKQLQPTGLYVSQSWNEKDSVVSISQKYADFRLHFFQAGTDQRQTRKGYNRGAMLSKKGGVGFFWDSFNAKGQSYAERLAKEINDLIKQ